MGKPLRIQPEDERRIENLKEKMGARTKMEIVRAGLTLLEQETAKLERIDRWKRAAKVVSAQNAEINKEFQRYSRFKRS
jgi:hypothetical protein